MSLSNAQENPAKKKDIQSMMQNDDMQNCMEKIAADSNMRMRMMNKMMDNAKNDSSGNDANVQDDDE